MWEVSLDNNCHGIRYSHLFKKSLERMRLSMHMLYYNPYMQELGNVRTSVSYSMKMESWAIIS